MAESENPLDLIDRALGLIPEWTNGQSDAACGPIAVKLLAFSDRSAAMSAGPLRRFEKSRAWAAEGALDVVAWLHAHGKLSGGAAMQRVAMARQLEKLPETEKAFQRGDLGYQHAAIMTRTAEHVGTAAVQEAESVLLAAAKTQDPKEFANVARELEHQLDAEAALRETNRAPSVAATST